MNYKNIFWGLLLIVLGTLFALQNFNYISINWDSIWQFWPLILIFVGINSLVKRDSTAKVGFILGLVFLVGFFIFIFTSVSFQSESDNSFNYNDEEKGIFNKKDKKIVNNQNFFQEMDSGVTSAKLNFQGAAGSFDLKQPTSKLFEAKANLSNGEYIMERINNGKDQEITLKLADQNISFNGKFKNEVTMMLNTKPEWQMDFEFGAGSAEIDLSDYLIKKLSVEAGAASLDLKLGDKSKNQEVVIEAGASSIDIDIPRSAACQITTETGLSSTDFEDFVKISDDLYQTENFSTSPNKIIITLSSGVSSISVSRY